ncbi:MAG TPA: Fur family transcriptional regulator [Smithella sp.]|nr:Fur family transcriptional regulator [Smithella sp.]
MMLNKNEFISLLREKGLKITPQRLSVIETLMENRYEHPGATLVYREARKKLQSISLSTVYATLKEFSECGLIRSLEFDRMENRYDLDLSEHINLVCKQCGSIGDFGLPCSIESKDIMRKSGFVVTDARMEYYGYCRNCQKKT